MRNQICRNQHLKVLLSTVVMVSFYFVSVAQNTVGVTINDDEASDDYCFFSPFSGRSAYLIDRCGKLINQWERGTRPGLSAYFLDNGLMLRTYKPSPQGPFTSASNAGGLELVDWNNNTVWSYELNTATAISHHDAVYMPNGNILMLTWELVFRDELIEMGRNPSEISSQGFMWSEKILEIAPVFPNEIEIVWQWEIRDHYVQEFDATKSNYHPVSEHPELFNINLPDINSSNSNASRDWNHFNSIDYNETLDQILISTRNSDEIWILDHSTTTEEAKGHSGGNSGKGGDILYRWGNPSAYQAAAESEQKLFGQHGVHWIRENLNDAGKIMLYNNGNGRPGTDFSTVEIIDPPKDSNGNYFLGSDGTFGPDEPEWIYGEKPEQYFYSPYLSNAQRLSNGNTLINSGSNGIAFEINETEEIVWSYTIPLFGDAPATQGQNVNNNAGFRVYKYPESYSGFDMLDLSPADPIELNPKLINCNPLATEDNERLPCKFHYNGFSNQLSINDIAVNEKTILQVFAFNGQMIHSSSINNLNSKALNLDSGIYFVRIMDSKKILCAGKLVVAY